MDWVVTIREFEDEDYVPESHWDQIELWQFGDENYWHWIPANVNMSYLKKLLV